MSWVRTLFLGLSYQGTNPTMGFPGGSDGKESACNAEDAGLIPGLGRSPGEGNGNSLQYSCLENPMDRGAWRAAAHVVMKSGTRLTLSPTMRAPPSQPEDLPKTSSSNTTTPWIRVSRYESGRGRGNHKHTLTSPSITQWTVILLFASSSILPGRKQIFTKAGFVKIPHKRKSRAAEGMRQGENLILT